MAERPIKVPYRNLRDDIELEMVSVEDDRHSRRHHHRIDLDSSPPHPSSSSSMAANGANGEFSPQAPPAGSHKCSLVILILSCTVAAGVQFGWALQLSLLTPYIQVRFFTVFVVI